MIHGENASNHGGNVWAGGAPSEWLDYSANIRPGGPPEWVRAALLRAMDNVPYYPQLSMERSRDALGRFLGLPAEAVLPTAGGIAAISLAAGLKVDRVRIPAPAFPGALQAPAVPVLWVLGQRPNMQKGSGYIPPPCLQIL